MESGGFVWHTTGSGKTLTSFKAARLATALDFIDKVFFVVDRKDLDYQTMKEYQRFSPDSVNGSDSTAGLSNLDKIDSLGNHCHHHPKAQQPDEERGRSAHLRQAGGERLTSATAASLVRRRKT